MRRSRQQCGLTGHPRPFLLFRDPLLHSVISSPFYYFPGVLWRPKPAVRTSPTCDSDKWPSTGASDSWTARREKVNVLYVVYGLVVLWTGAAATWSCRTERTGRGGDTPAVPRQVEGQRQPRMHAARTAVPGRVGRGTKKGNSEKCEIVLFVIRTTRVGQYTSEESRKPGLGTQGRRLFWSKV